MNTPDIEKVSHTFWDAIVIGTGIGGGTLGYALAKAGKKVLFVERGRSSLGESPSSIIGDYAENISLRESNAADNEELMKRAGRLTDNIIGTSTKSDTSFVPLLGAGTGGSSALFGMTMERLFPEDFEPKKHFPNSPSANLPERWPISYEELQPFYTKAEMLYQVKATTDPLRPQGEERGIQTPPPFSRANQELADHFKRKNFDLYHQAMACQYKPGCKECLGFICDKSCKGDSTLHCLEPALNKYGATLLEDCEVTRLCDQQGSIKYIECLYQGKTLQLTGKLIFLAAGAIHTPMLLLKSKTDKHRNGLANQSDMVGRNFMRHYYEYFFVATKVKVQAGDLQKQLAYNNLYLHEGEKLGTVQSFGPFVPASMIVKQLINDLRKSSRVLAWLAGIVRPLLEFIIHKLFHGRPVLCAMLEDPPYADNRISLGPNGEIQLYDRVHDDEKKRLSRFQAVVKEHLAPYKYIHSSAAGNFQVLGHQCGTCRFGDDPNTSVLNKYNRAHQLDNLYIVDASFLPTSGGTNPALTIAANALRVADYIVSEKLI